nr:hypothetical protein [Tanacetum cinerariifolium]
NHLMNDTISPVLLRSLFSSRFWCFNQLGLVLILGRCAASMSSESEIFTSSGIGTSSTGCSE